MMVDLTADKKESGKVGLTVELTAPKWADKSVGWMVENLVEQKEFLKAARSADLKAVERAEL